MNANPSRSLAIGVSARALFDLREQEEVLRDHGRDAFRRHQLEQLDEVLPAGPSLAPIRSLLRNCAGGGGIEVVVLSEGIADSSLRVLSSAQHYDLEPTRAAFTDGDPLAPYLRAYRVDLFLSTETEEVASAMEAGTAAALVRPRSGDSDSGPVRVAVDGRAVAEALENADAEVGDIPEEGDGDALPGPLIPRWVRALAGLQRAAGPEEKRLRTALVSCESSATHARILRALHDWDLRLDQAFFTGESRAEVLDTFEPDIIFDRLRTEKLESNEARVESEVSAMATRKSEAASSAFSRLRPRS
jgi:5'-nucleotidase